MIWVNQSEHRFGRATNFLLEIEMDEVADVIAVEMMSLESPRVECQGEILDRDVEVVSRYSPWYSRHEFFIFTAVSEK
jgi:hypothetical protein